MSEFKTYKKLADYQKLNFEERLRAYLFEKEIVKIEVEEIGLEDDPIVDLREIKHELALGENLKDFRVRRGLLDRLMKANSELKKHGLGLKIYEMYRSLAQQRKEFGEIKTEMAAKYPDLNADELWAKTTEFIADPDLCPPHSTGGAVDLTLINLANGEEIEMGTPVNSLEKSAALFDDSISEAAQKKRQILSTAMLEQGLAPMCTEWWHYSYGEAYWAALYGVPQIYQSLDLN